jgi:hypothetical protein
MKTIWLKKRIEYRMGTHLNPNVPYKAHWDNDLGCWKVHSCENVRLAVNPKYVSNVVDAEPVLV